MVIVECPFPGCTHRTPDLPPEVVGPLLTIHAITHSRPPATPSRGPKLNRPTIDVGVDEETWNAFVRRWETFKHGSDIDEGAAPTQLFQCASDALGDLLLKSDPELTKRTAAEVLEAMKSMAVIPVARGVSRAELFQMSQSADEQIRTFSARVRGKAETCGFTTTVKCQCSKEIKADYTEEVIRDIILAGISDLDIRRDVLSMPGILEKSTNDVVGIIESREMARNATPLSSVSVSAMSSYKQARQPRPPAASFQKASASPQHDRNPVSQQTIPCPECGKQFHRFRERPNGAINKVPYKQCLDCFRTSKKKLRDSDGANFRALELDSDQIFQISALGPNSKHPKVHIHVGCAKDRDILTPVEAIADTGAMTNVWGLSDFQKAGFSMEQLEPTSAIVRAANGQKLDICGQFNAIVKGKSPSDEDIRTNTVIFVSKCVNGLFISKETLIKLFIINEDFPVIGQHKNGKHFVNYDVLCNSLDNEGKRDLLSGCSHPIDDSLCKCPQRTAVPPKPKSLPFAPTPENIPNMKQWLLDRYASSTFNTCPHRALPCMTGPPMEIHIDEDATPKVCHTPATVPLHWQKRVYDDLLRDEALGVLERVPTGVPVTWCHRMVVTRKHDGTPRRTVDLSPLNKFCTRETFPAEAPFHLARRVPGKTWKTVTDAWNGYHSVPLKESDRHLTTFITPFGKWRYTRAPQGFLSSGDGYNKRFDAILADFVRKERCVDDTIHYDEDIEEHWWRTINLLEIMGNSGAVMNPDKLQFCQRQADFAGFRIGETNIEPLPKYIEAIRSFPTPKSTKDIRSWFGLVNQVANYGQLREFMALFRPFLSPKHTFFWSLVLDKAFEESKTHIIEAIRQGVEIFDMSKPTCLRPDWSTQGIGYFLVQKHCPCNATLPDCCPDGWKVTLAGSRFLTAAEKRYAAIEGEALAVAWGLEQTKYFTQGSPNLVVATDHKPLVKIFGDRTLDEISNTRLFRLKQRTLPWRFVIQHLPGKTNLAADAASRYPNPDSSGIQTCAADQSERLMMAAISSEAESITTVSWELLAEETRKDRTLSTLRMAIQEGFSQAYDEVADFVRYRDSLYISEDVILYQDRVVVPLSLRKTILQGLHAAHQGVSAMQSRAQSIVFWPGMTLDIQDIRSRCRECNRNAPSQAPTPSEPANPPLTPFEQIFADFFEFAGHHYLVAGDRLSGWCEIFFAPSGTAWSGARGLIGCLRSMFSTFGVPDELSSDGGPEFIAGATKDFLKRWKINHRISSAYHPQSNGRAEVAVKTAKRLLRTNVGQNGSLDNDKLLRALLQLRNTPDPDCNLSPAQIIFGRPIRDSLSFINRLDKYSNPHIRPTWREAWASKEDALRTRFSKTSEILNEHAKPLMPLKTGDKCFIQNQTGTNPNKWHRTGTVVEVADHDQYIVKVDGSGRLTKRNRRFLKVFKPASMTIESAPTTNMCDTQVNTEPKQQNGTTDSVPPVTVHDTVDEHYTPDDRVPDPPTPTITSSRDRASNIQNVPAMLKRLQSHNSDGLKEDIVPPDLGGRPRRRQPDY